jgi:hypothetical protein
LEGNQKMRIQRAFARALSGALLTALIAGCSGNSNVPGVQAAPKQGMTQSHTGAHKFIAAHGGPSKQAELVCNSLPNLLHVSQFVANTIKIYPNVLGNANPAPVATITASQGLNGPAGMIVDPPGSILYVANFGAQNVLLFKKCGTGPGFTLNDSPFNPIDVAVANSSTGMVYVSNFTSPSVTVFVGGSANYTPSLTLTDPNARSGAGITIDSGGNCFWAFQDNSGQGRVDEFVNCVMPGVTLALNPTIKRAAGIQMDFPANRMLLDDALAPRTYRIPPPYTGVPFIFPGPTVRPLFLSLRNNETRLYVADANGRVRRYFYPGGGQMVPLTNGLSSAGKVTGVSVWPPAPL